MLLHHSQSKAPSESLAVCSKARRTACRRPPPCSSAAKAELVQTSAAKRALVFGLGYTTLGIANTLRQAGWHITATYRTPKACDAILSRGWEAVLFDPCSDPGHISPELMHALESSSHVISSIPPVGLPLYDPVLQAQLKALKQMDRRNLTWIGYLSSTGVYGDHAGEWVDEESTCQPRAARGYVRYEHEVAWSKVCTAHHMPLHIFRLGGIYGPGRSLLSSGPSGSSRGPKPVEAQGQTEVESSSKSRRGQQKYISRIHVLDICQTVMASMQAAHGGSSTVDGVAGESTNTSPAAVPCVYNLVDDEPASRGTVKEFISSLQQGGLVDHQPVNQPAEAAAEAPNEPRAVPAGGSSTKRPADPVEEKRVRNSKMKQALGATLVFPTYREGMSALMAGDIRPFTKKDLEFLNLNS